MSLETYDHIFEPGTDPSAAPLILLHGTGGDARRFLEFGRLVAPTAPALAVTGDVNEHGMRRFFRRTGEGVYDMEDLAIRTDAFDAFLAAAIEIYELDAARAIGLGYSNGANLLANLAFRHPTRLNRLALMHPLIPFTPPNVDLAGLSALITAGRRDPISPAALTADLAEHLTVRGATVDLVWRPGGHEIDGGEIEAARHFVQGA